MKFGGEWMHTLNDQVFRGFFTGRYLFDSVTGFLRYASPAAAGGFGPSTVGCSDGVYVTSPTPCPAGTTTSGGPLLLYLQGAGLNGPATDAAGASKITQRGVLAVRAGPVAAAPEPDAELRAALGRAADAGDGGPADDGVWRLPQRSGVPVGRDHPGPVGHVPAARRRGVGHQRERPVGRARQRRRVLGAAEHAHAGRLGDDQRPAAADALREYRQPHGLRRADAGLARAAHARAGAGRAVPAVQRRPRLSQGLQEPARLFVQRRLRAGARAGLGRLRRLHVGRGTQPHAVPELQPYGAGLLQRRAGHREHLRLHPGVGTAARRGDGHQQPRRITLPRRDVRHPQALLEGLSARRQLRAREGRGQRFERARSVHRSQLQLLRSRPRTGGRRTATSATR